MNVEQINQILVLNVYTIRFKSEHHNKINS